MRRTEAMRAKESGAGRVSLEKVMEDLKTVVTDAEELLQATVNQTGERIAAAREKAEESLKAAKARLAEHEEALIAKTQAVARATDDYVHSNPWKSVGIAALIGLVVGVLVSRR